MNPAPAFEIAQLALSLVAVQLPGQTQQDFLVEETLLEIVQRGAIAYRQHTGEALDPALLHVEEPL